MKIAAADDLQVGGALRKPDSAESARIGIVGERDRTRLRRATAGPARCACRPTGRPRCTTPSLQARWFAHDLHAGLPRLPASQREQWTPQQLSLERLHAFSVKKGCYPGQEIVARTHFLGKAKRGLVLFESRRSTGKSASKSAMAERRSAASSAPAARPTPVSVGGIAAGARPSVPLACNGDAIARSRRCWTACNASQTVGATSVAKARNAKPQ